MGRPATECESHVNEKDSDLAVSRVPRGTRNPDGIIQDHLESLNTNR